MPSSASFPTADATTPTHDPPHSTSAANVSNRRTDPVRQHRPTSGSTGQAQRSRRARRQGQRPGVSGVDHGPYFQLVARRTPYPQRDDRFQPRVDRAPVGHGRVAARPRSR